MSESSNYTSTLNNTGQKAAQGRVIDILLFIQGVDVTHLVQSCDISFGIDSSLEVTLNNANNALVLTKTNLDNSWRLNESSTVWDRDHSENAKKALYDYKLAHNTVGTSGQLNQDNLRRWNLGASEPLIHKMDAICLFVKKPDTDADYWYPKFRGYVASTSLGTDLLTGESNISVSCRDVKMVLAKSRIAQNPIVTGYGTLGETVINEEVMAQSSNSSGQVAAKVVGLFQDSKVNPEQVTKIIYNRDPVEIINFCIFGTYTESGAISEGSSMLAFGNFRNAEDRKRFLISGREERPDLEAWHTASLLGSDSDGQPRITPYSRDECIAIGMASDFDGPESPHGSNRCVRFLYPTEGFGFSTLTPLETSNFKSMEADWISRLDILDTFLNPLYYQFWVAGNGDLIFEYPLSDFKPELFGKYLNEFKLEDFTNYTYSENDTDIPTLLTVKGGDVSGTAQNGQSEATQNALRVDLFFPSLASRFGIMAETVYLPYTQDHDRLCFYGLVVMQQKLCELESYSVSGIPGNLNYTPNRPIYLPDFDAIITVQNGGISITVGDSSDLSLTLTMANARKRNKDGTFRTMFGSESQPLNYNYMYKTENTFSQALRQYADTNPEILYIVHLSGASEINPDARVSATPGKPNARASEDEIALSQDEKEVGSSMSSKGKKARGDRNNNPGNIESNSIPWQGKTGSDGRFATFETPEHGIRALAKDLNTKYNRGLNNVEDIINTYAPPFENNTKAYIAAVSNQLGVSPNQPLNLSDPTTVEKFSKAIIQHELGYQPYSQDQIVKSVDSALNGTALNVEKSAPTEIASI
ncbi:hypothetical protein [Yersinia ruckeri]|uniref:hypothetical protein n=1 Tax=Yersinia ruckeri TaxID=29486 RepID=UPI00223711A8|nr:hypothetical protein [Yersinia ruckeri]MCW6598751.1 hypothetical protein [Yersinia ruckeri]